MTDAAEYEEFVRVAAELGIDATRPGFHNSDEFRQLEQEDPALLEAYADVVRLRRYSEGELAFARERVGSLRDFFQVELSADGRLGGCVDVSALALAMLQEEGVWGFQVNGSLVLELTSPAATSRVLKK
jgi:hypothetical protein